MKMLSTNFRTTFLRGLPLYRTFLILLALAGIGIPVSLHAGFGVSPGVIEETRLVPGASFERVIYLVQGDPKVDLPATISIESSDIEDWISFKEGTSFTIPAGVQQFPLTVRITAPPDTPLGEYKAFIRINTTPQSDPDNQVTIALGGRVDVRLVVGDEVVTSFEVMNIDIRDIKENHDPTADIIIQNTGNAPVAPDHVSFELFNKYGDIRLGYAETDAFEKIAAFSKETITASFPIDIRLAPGEYWGHILVYDDTGVVKELRTVFNVLPETFFEKYALQAMAIVGALFLLLIAFLYLKLRARRQ
jgi:hypothetical protein